MNEKFKEELYNAIDALSTVQELCDYLSPLCTKVERDEESNWIYIIGGKDDIVFIPNCNQMYILHKHLVTFYYDGEDKVIFTIVKAQIIAKLGLGDEQKLLKFAIMKFGYRKIISECFGKENVSLLVRDILYELDETNSLITSLFTTEDYNSLTIVAIGDRGEKEIRLINVSKKDIDMIEQISGVNYYVNKRKIEQEYRQRKNSLNEAFSSDIDGAIKEYMDNEGGRI